MVATTVAVPGLRTRGVPDIRKITTADLRDALRLGVEDFKAMPSHLVFLGLIYPLLGLVLASFAFGYDVLPLLYPLVSGFALVGPLAGIGLYELSRRRELGQDPSWRDAFEVLRSPSIGSIVALGVVLVVVFLAWMLAAQAVYGVVFGAAPIASYADLLREIVTTPRGWTLILVGNAVGGAFAALVLLVSVIGFPAILDRHLGVGEAIAVSARAVMANPVEMVLWGAIVAALVVLGSVPLFVGLAVVMPILGHATWHLYRKLVA